MKHFRKQLNSGNLTATLPVGAELNGQPVSGRCTIRPGDTVKCDPADLGKSGIKSFEEVAAPTGKPKSPVKSKIARLKTILRQKSKILNPGLVPGIGQIFHVPTDRAGQADILADLENEDFNQSGQAVGAMSAAKLRVNSAWSAWDYQCKKVNPNGTKSLKNPEGEFLEAIALAEAQMAVLKAEIAEVRKRIAAATEVEANQVDDRAAKMKFRGIGKLQEGRFVEMDARPVKYGDDGLPYFADDGMPLADYKELIRAHKAEQSKKRAAKAAKESKRQAPEATA